MQSTFVHASAHPTPSNSLSNAIDRFYPSSSFPSPVFFAGLTDFELSGWPRPLCQTPTGCGHCTRAAPLLFNPIYFHLGMCFIRSRTPVNPRSLMLSPARPPGLLTQSFMQISTRLPSPRVPTHDGSTDQDLSVFVLSTTFSPFYTLYSVSLRANSISIVPSAPLGIDSSQ